VSEPVLEIEDLHVWFGLKGDAELHAVQGMSFAVGEGERFGLVMAIVFAAVGTVLYGSWGTGVCLRMRLLDVDVAATDTVDGLWFAGCFAVTRDGAAHGFEPLDIELRYQGEICPS